MASAVVDAVSRDVGDVIIPGRQQHGGQQAVETDVGVAKSERILEEDVDKP